MDSTAQERRRALEKGLVCEDPRELSPEFARSVEGLTRDIKDPVERLRFLRNSTKTIRQLEDQIPKVPALARPLVYKYLGWRGLTMLKGERAAGIRRGARGKIAALQIGIVIAGAGLLLGASYGTIRLAASLGRKTPTVEARVHSEIPAAAVPQPTPMPEPEILTQRPNSIWLVEKGKDYELYSNGLRIDTTQRLKGTRRSYAPIDEASGGVLPLASEPVGIVFHTTESDILSLEAENNASLLRNSKNLVAYIKRHEFYHYLIDRFGRVYQILNDDSRANHAGFAVWANAGRVYMNLNHAFFGVSFESRFAPEGPLPLTEAQLQAGRLLTEHLVRRYDLDPKLCVGHGIVSVNPKTRRIGHHVDWAKNFPFKTFGLPDAYQVEPASVRLFGFGYDDDLAKAIGEPWPGVFKAEAELQRDALKSGQSTDELKQALTRRYDLWFEEQSQAAKSTTSSLITAPAPAGPGVN
ncbi:MAG TPA: N-acetylmuramoyl-L-alanine amidase [Vicinamibacteria bacterium]|nr:N-acetylmuramoyl-L-alanine amidase [Vicinamibacteria bacterium]